MIYLLSNIYLKAGPQHEIFEKFQTLPKKLLGNRKSNGKNLQPRAKYLRQTLDLMKTLFTKGKVQFLVFSNFYASIGKVYILEGGLETRL